MNCRLWNLFASTWIRPCRKVKYGFQASFSDTFILDTFIGYLYSGILNSVIEVAFPFKPFDLGPCIFPGYFGFTVLDFPWIGYDNVAFSNPHSLLFRAWNPAHAHNPIHTLKCYPLRAE